MHNNNDLCCLGQGFGSRTARTEIAVVYCYMLVKTFGSAVVLFFIFIRYFEAFIFSSKRRFIIGGSDLLHTCTSAQPKVVEEQL